MELATLTRQHARGIVPEVAYIRASSTITAEIARLDTVSAPRQASPLNIASAQQAWKFLPLTEKNKTLRQLINNIKITEHGQTIHTAWGKAVPLV